MSSGSCPNNNCRIGKYPLTKEIKEQAELLGMIGEPTRLRILALLFEHPYACVNQISDAVGISIALASHHLQIIKEAGIVSSERQGQTMCYRVLDNERAAQLRQIIKEI